jgi:hypothetical protein
MKAIEFESQMTSDHLLAVPAAVAQGIPELRMNRVLVLVPESDDDQRWEHMAAIDFGQGCAGSDSVYDELSER